MAPASSSNYSIGSMLRSQLLVRNIDGKTLSLQLPSVTVSGAELKSLLEGKTGIPRAAQRLLFGSHHLADEETLSADQSGDFPTCSLLLRLVGGKGGFGSLLRGAATKAGQKKTSNFDACRDMSGRRLRHVNAEKQLKEWKAEAKDRELERAGEEHIKRLVRETKERDVADRELDRLREASHLAMENVSSAVQVGLIEAKKQAAALGKRKMEEEAAPQKKNRLWEMLETVDDDDDEDDDEEEEGEGERNNSGDSSSGVEGSSKSDEENENADLTPTCPPASDKQTVGGSSEG